MHLGALDWGGLPGAVVKNSDLNLGSLLSNATTIPYCVPLGYLLNTLGPQVHYLQNEDCNNSESYFRDWVT